MKSATRLSILAIALTLFISTNASATTHNNRIICEHAEEIVCMADDMKDEIKCHFRGVKGYGRLLGANALVKAKAAAIKRRVNRNACYSRLAIDANRLDELVCEMQALYQEVLACSTHRRPVNGDTFHIEAKMAAMRELSSCIHAEACVRLGLAAPVVVIPVQHPTFEPMLEPILAPISEPIIIQPILDETEFNAPRIETNYPPITPRSILEIRTDPIIELDPILPPANPSNSGFRR